MKETLLVTLLGLVLVMGEEAPQDTKDSQVLESRQGLLDPLGLFSSQNSFLGSQNPLLGSQTSLLGSQDRQPFNPLGDLARLFTEGLGLILGGGLPGLARLGVQPGLGLGGLTGLQGLGLQGLGLQGLGLGGLGGLGIPGLNPLSRIGQELQLYPGALNRLGLLGLDANPLSQLSALRQANLLAELQGGDQALFRSNDAQGTVASTQEVATPGRLVNRLTKRNGEQEDPHLQENDVLANPEQLQWLADLVHKNPLLLALAKPSPSPSSDVSTQPLTPTTSRFDDFDTVTFPNKHTPQNPRQNLKNPPQNLSPRPQHHNLHDTLFRHRVTSRPLQVRDSQAARDTHRRATSGENFRFPDYDEY